MSKSGSGSFGRAYTADAVNVRPEASFKVFEDQVFSISKRLTYPSTGIVNIIADPTSCSCGILALQPLKFKAAFAGPIHIDIYANPTFTPNTPLETLNRDFTSDTEAEILWYLNPTISDDGVLLPPEFIILSDGTAAVASLGGESQEDLISNIDLTIPYLIRATNQEANVAQGGFSANWFELPAG